MEKPNNEAKYSNLTCASPVVQKVKNLPTMPETQISSLGGEAPLEKGMATHSNILAWRIPWTEEPRGLQSMGSQRVQTQLNDEHFHFRDTSGEVTSGGLPQWMACQLR